MVDDSSILSVLHVSLYLLGDDGVVGGTFCGGIYQGGWLTARVMKVQYLSFTSMYHFRLVAGGSDG